MQKIIILGYKNCPVSVTPQGQKQILAQSLSNSSRITVLDRINNLTSDQLHELYKKMVQNEFVKEQQSRHILLPTLEQFNQYFKLLKKGFKYAEMEYGQIALPSNLILYQGSMKNFNDKKDFIFYNDETDEIGISLVKIAGNCCWYGNPLIKFIEPRLPIGASIRPEDFTTLQAIEEAYHRYQRRHLGLDTECCPEDINNPFEQPIKFVFEKAIKDLGIELYYIKPVC